jgi:hypothetical protein
MELLLNYFAYLFTESIVREYFQKVFQDQEIDVDVRLLDNPFVYITITVSFSIFDSALLSFYCLEQKLNKFCRCR